MHQGWLAPMAQVKKATIQDVAASASISGTTVSYIISGGRSGESGFGEATKKRVLESAKVYPNMIAQY